LGFWGFGVSNRLSSFLIAGKRGVSSLCFISKVRLTCLVIVTQPTACVSGLDESKGYPVLSSSIPGLTRIAMEGVHAFHSLVDWFSLQGSKLVCWFGLGFILATLVGCLTNEACVSIGCKVTVFKLKANTAVTSQLYPCREGARASPF
jgi:hypothetical protein